MTLCCYCSNKDIISSDVLASAKVFVIAGSREMFTATEVTAANTSLHLHTYGTDAAWI